MQHDRYTETKQSLMKILAVKGTIYTLGLLMGIIARRSQTDWDIFKEIEHRAKEL